MLSTKLRLFPDHRAGRPAAPGDEARGGRGLPPVTSLLLKRASTSRPSGEWSDEDYDVLADGGAVVGIFKVHAAPVGTPWMWTLAFGHHEDRTPTHAYAATREAAMSALALATGVRAMSAFGGIRTCIGDQFQSPLTRLTPSGHSRD